MKSPIRTFASIFTFCLMLVAVVASPLAAQAVQAAPEALEAGFSLGDSLGDWLTGLVLSAPIALGTVRNFVPTVWSQNLNLRFRKMRVFSALTNSDYEGEISDEGDTVKITRPGSINVFDYTGADITFEEPSSSQQQLVIDQAKAFAFQIDDVDAVQANVNLVQTYTREAADKQADVADQFIAGKYTDVPAANVIAKQSLTSDNVYSVFVEAGKRLDDQNVPQSGRVAVVSSKMYALIKEAPEFIRATDLGDQVVQRGALGMISGFMVHMSNNVQVANDGTDNVEHNLFGHPASITFANQWANVEATRLESKFGDGVKGLNLYGAKVIRPKALVDVRRIA